MVLFVCEREDSSAREARALWEAAGAIVHVEPDVYAAMARLGEVGSYERVLVDVRWLDRQELAFLTLAPRYFPEIVIQTPWLSGTSDAVVALGHPDLKTSEVAAIADSLKASREVSADVAAAPEEAEPRSAALSTDGVDAGPEPSLHDAVRMRMASDAPVPARRPPNRTPPAVGQIPQENRNISPEELEALFDAGEIEDGNGGAGA